MENLRKKKLFIFDMDNCLYKDVDRQLEKNCFFDPFYDFVANHYGYSLEKVEKIDDDLMGKYGHYLKGWCESHPDFPLAAMFENFKNIIV